MHRMLISKKQKDLQCCYKSVQHSAFLEGSSINFKTRFAALLFSSAKERMRILFTVVKAVSAEEKYADNMSKYNYKYIYRVTGPQVLISFCIQGRYGLFSNHCTDWMNIVKFCLFQVSVKSA